MPGIFGQIVSAFQGILSRGFWFGSFLPVAVFAALNVILLQYVSPANNDLLTRFVSANWVWTAPIVAALIVIAYAIAPLLPLCRAILDGRLLSDRLYALLCRYPDALKTRAANAATESGRRLGEINMVRLRA